MTIEHKLLCALLQQGASLALVANKTGINTSILCRLKQTPNRHLSITSLNKLLQFYCFFKKAHKIQKTNHLI